MQYRFTVDVEVNRTQGKFASRDEILEQLQDAIAGADPGTVEGENGGQYDVTSWDVNEVPEPKPAAKPRPAAPAPPPAPTVRQLAVEAARESGFLTDLAALKQSIAESAIPLKGLKES